MRACARVALVLMIVSASLSLGACGAIDDLRDTVTRWFDIGSPGQPASADAQSHGAPTIPPEKSLKNEASKASKKKDKLATKVHRPQTAEHKPPTSHTIEAAKPQRAELQSVPPQPTPAGLRSLYPDAPQAGTFSR